MEDDRLTTFDSIFLHELSIHKSTTYKYWDYYINGKIYRTHVEKIWDELVKKDGNPNSYSTQKVLDIQAIKAEFIIENIACAFEAYKKPCPSHLSFEIFCEYVLP